MIDLLLSLNFIPSFLNIYFSLYTIPMSTTQQQISKMEANKAQTTKNQQILLDNFNFNECRLQSVFAKIRPYRQGGIRLEYEGIKDKHIFHNYGHGSSGVALAYGSAFMSLKQLSVHVKDEEINKCAVIGAGLIGLLTANELAKLGFNVTLYSRHPIQANNRRSSTQMDDGLWLPFGYDFSSNRLLYELLSKISYEYYKDCRKLGKYQAIKVATVYERDRSVADLKKIIPPFLYNGYKKVDVDFKTGVNESYIKFKTFKINMQMFVEELKVQSLLRGVKFVQTNFKNIEEVLKLEENVIFNCTGFQSKKLFGDQKVKGYIDHTILFRSPYILDFTLIAKFTDKLQARIHCEGNKILIRSQNLINAEDIDHELVRNMTEETNKYFSQRSGSMEAKL